MGEFPVHAISRRPSGFSVHSGMDGACRILGLEPFWIPETWTQVRARSWTAGEWLRRWGNRWYGSEWNALVPMWDEWRIRRCLPEGKPHVVHWLWGEFAAPKRAEAYRKRGGKVVVSVHCSARRWEKVWRRPDGYARADRVVLTSESQREFVERDVPRERVRRIFLGVDCSCFVPGERRESGEGRLRLLLLGNTERDHAFAAAVARRLPAERFEWRVRTLAPEKKLYDGLACVTMLRRLSDAELVEEYRRADLLCMPMLDSAANDVFLESMACGTPVMTNRVGGVPEYVAGDCNVVMPADSDADVWADRLLELERNRETLDTMRSPVRAWAERFDWRLVAEDYRALYRELLGM